MADGPALALQAALVARLRADAGVGALVGARVYDEPPDGATLPLVRIGNIDVAPERMDGCTDEAVTFSIEAHSRPISGRVEASRIAHAIRSALDEADFVVTGHHLDWCQFLTQAVTRGADGKTYVATVAFQAALSAP
ncbi:DUF3168 domain-containing protein [Rhodobacter capsulatus]|jgi:hypothetical protein|uniref:Gene transfer agent (GTA) orfg8-like protein n=1 Tax=Rhodobacter phage RcapNL TaxID=1131316 RepID=H6WBL7_9CAUD|nr:DUF3168 domain-containing protein [Rhodobacter capsulatus]YP_007518396.1 DUF3168 domain-containing protein [Rhodobacter phage RcapNL]AFK66521.1 hypothetical protein RHZG_00014 [Rhodobacter phage RcNL1]AFA44854.1 gene transfer agent (GTA) orfg8-like protein [Rhodobacter phage RcapNL]ETD02725.1 hypothetical protein U714_04205 [Rhodobacter capsulatus DE442]ETD78882.1 hypothetical protein U717_04210 [Rhodobacter capsulatus R121]ETE54861.1 hypothetical protein U715_04200 [Rhodobacter capsulatus